MFLGEFDTGATVRFKFTTRAFATGAPTTLSGTPAVSVYKDGSTTESTTGVTLTADFDSRTGLNQIAVDMSSDGTFYSTGSDFVAVITTGTVGGTSVVGEVLCQWSTRNRASLYPTTAARTLDVSAGGDADAVVQSIANNAITAAAIASDAITSAKIATDAIGAAQIAADAIGSSELATSAVNEIQAAVAAGAVASVTGNVGGNVVGSVGSVASGGITSTSFAAGAIDAAAIATDAIGSAELAASAVTEIQSGLATSANQSTILTNIAAVQADTDDIQTRLPAALVSGRIDASVGAVANNAITAASIATDAIDADAMADGAITAGTFAAGAIDATAIAADAIGASELAASAVTEIQSGLATATAVDDLPTNAELATALAAADDAVLAAIAALNNLSAAQVNAEVLDVLGTDVQAELTSIPAAATTLISILKALHATNLNRLEETGTGTSGTLTLKNRANNATIGTAATSDDGSTAVRGSFS